MANQNRKISDDTSSLVRLNKDNTPPREPSAMPPRSVSLIKTGSPSGESLMEIARQFKQLPQDILRAREVLQEIGRQVGPAISNVMEVTQAIRKEIGPALATFVETIQQIQQELGPEIAKFIETMQAIRQEGGPEFSSFLDLLFPEQQIRARAEALSRIVELGYEPYPHRFARTHSISEIVRLYKSKTGEELEAERPHVVLAGRIHAINRMGKAGFIRFTDGAKLLQIYIRSNEIDERTW